MGGSAVDDAAIDELKTVDDISLEYPKTSIANEEATLRRDARDIRDERAEGAPPSLYQHERRIPAVAQSYWTTLTRPG